MRKGIQLRGIYFPITDIWTGLGPYIEVLKQSQDALRRSIYEEIVHDNEQTYKTNIDPSRRV